MVMASTVVTLHHPVPKGVDVESLWLVPYVLANISASFCAVGF